MMKILLTGGSGFIGRNILESWLVSRYTVFAPTHSELELMDEFAVKDYIKKNKIDVIIHTAAKPGHRNAPDPKGIFYTNTRIFFNLAVNADLFDKMIITGSGAIYDMRFYTPRMKEEYFGSHIPLDEHGFSKYVTGKYIEKSDRIIDLRIFGIFGKYEDYSIRFISNMICKALYGLPLTMKQDRFFDYLYVEDLFPVLDHFIKNKANFREYNVTPDKTLKLSEIADIVRKISGRDDLPVIASSKGLGPEYSGDNSRLKKEMTLINFSPIEDSIKKLYNWYGENIDNIDKNLLLIDS
jgi:GDP-L-fucose synthase